MKGYKKHNSQIEINDLIDDAVTNALTRRGLVESLPALSNEETAGITGGFSTKPSIDVVPDYPEIAIAGFKQVEPICPPIKPICLPIKPIYPPIKPVVKPICPPVIAGLVFIPDYNKSLSS